MLKDFFRLALVAAIVAFSGVQIADASSLQKSSPPYRDATTLVFEPIPDNRIMDHISPSLPHAERELMRSVMLQLPPTKRYNVMYFDLKGNIHANYPNLVTAARAYQPLPHNDRLGVARDGSQTILSGALSNSARGIRPYAYSCANPPGSTSTGAFRAVYSTCNTPYALSHVYLPCKSGGQIFINYPNNEVPYIYEGGFSGKGDAIDAGMQYSWTYDNWAIFMNGDHGQASINPRYQCNQTVPIEFYPASATLLAVDVTGYTTNGYANYTETYAVASFAGWAPNCSACIVKRVTSLAQVGSGFPSYVTGSYVGIDSSFNPSVRWSNSYIGYWTGQTPVRYNIYSWTASYTGGYRSYPDTRRVRVLYYDPGDELDGIIMQ